MAGAVFFLLLGMLFSEFALLGLDWAGVVGAALLTMSSTLLVHLAFADYEAKRQPSPARGRTKAPARKPVAA